MFESTTRYLVQKLCSAWNAKRYRRIRYNRWYKSSLSSKELTRFLYNCINKNFDESFSLYCHRYPNASRVEFLKEFRDRYLKYQHIWYSNFFVDENGLIQENKWRKSKKPIYVCSFDYKSEKYKHPELALSPKREIRNYYKNFIEPQVGWIEYFEKKDKSYLKCRAKRFFEYRKYKKEFKESKIIKAEIELSITKKRYNENNKLIDKVFKSFKRNSTKYLDILLIKQLSEKTFISSSSKKKVKFILKTFNYINS